MRNRRYTCVLLTLLLVSALFAPAALAANAGDVVISEIAWMGTTTSTANEWIEPR